jgi:DNA repair photolyase
MIISASRRTDIPNYFSDWFYNRLSEGYVCVRNPMNFHQISKIPLTSDAVDCFVFWTKNPKNMLSRLNELSDFSYYFQFTLTGYGKDIEPNLPSKRDELISTFIELSELVGREKVIWRYDPILLNDRYTFEYHMKAFNELADKLNEYTEKVVISFIDLYAKTQRNTKDLALANLTIADMKKIGKEFSDIAHSNNLIIETCAETLNLDELNIKHGKCIDDELIKRISGSNINVRKDSNQRLECGCVESIDIGAYNTCKNGCKYCYANLNTNIVNENNKQHNFKSHLLYGEITKEDKVTDRKVKSIKENQLSIFDII